MSNFEGNGRKFDLEERLIAFSVTVIEFVDNLPGTAAGRHFGGQLIRSGTSPAFNYGEAQGAESRRDFIHKMGICLKELREVNIALKIIHRSSIFPESELLQWLLKECDELVAIFTSSVQTAKSNA